jgi:formylmethanofuran dehydrogenase subunit B
MDRAVAAGEVDAALWLASLPVPLPPWRDQVPMVALLPRPTGEEARIVFAVAEPGTESDGALWHARRGAIVHHGAAAGGTAPAAAGILARLEGALLGSRAVPC